MTQISAYLTDCRLVSDEETDRRISKVKKLEAAGGADGRLVMEAFVKNLWGSNH